MNYRQTLGQYGEELAKNYLIRHGYQIVSSNIKVSYKEIDLIVKKDDILVFVEVRTRASLIYGEADESLTPSKIKNFRKGINIYLSLNDFSENDIRADLVAVDIDRAKKTAKIKHYFDIL